MSDQIKARLLKLLALAERGIGGEKETAEQKLKEAMERHGVQMSDLVDDVRNMEWFSWGKDGPLLNSLLMELFAEKVAILGKIGINADVLVLR